jgi:hypothetical protein
MDTKKAIVRIDQFRDIQLQRGKAPLSVEHGLSLNIAQQVAHDVR